ncbi:unnamed protein product, partial [Medioppia subpectinata]
MNQRMGKLMDLNRFDNTFFGLMDDLMLGMKPHERMALETTYEAIMDAGETPAERRESDPDFGRFPGNRKLLATLGPGHSLTRHTTISLSLPLSYTVGISPEKLRGSRRVGVYVGTTVYSNIESLLEEIQPDVMPTMEVLSMMNSITINTMAANRLSYVFDFRGPSMTIDTACSASLSALNVALNDIKLGNIDYAVVAGIHTTLQPLAIQIGQKGGILSPRGQSCPLDESADGFVKAEAVCCVLLQRRQSACRVYASVRSAGINNDGKKTIEYASVRSAGINNDGKKTIGMFCPSSEAQEELMVDTYTKAGIDPLELTYIEAHLTGTKVGDPAEVLAIYRAYCERTGRTQPLPLGTLKSNMGHSEGASGLTSLIKVMIAFENECIPPNLNIKNLKQEIRQYCPPLLPVTQKLKYKPGLAAVNNFGIGGVNDHVIVEPNPRVPSGDSHRLCEPMAR